MKTDLQVIVSHGIDLQSHLSNSSSVVFDLLRRRMLSSNQIRHVRPGTFKSLSSVLTILLDRNNITRLERGFLKECIRLFELNLSENQIKVVEPDTFLGLYSLILLNLSRNAIQVIQPGAFTDLYFLSFIDLSFNQIPNITRDTFLEAPYLMTILLMNNRIKVIPKGVFGASKFLSNLYLEHNGITDIAGEAFKENSFLQLLRLINNSITHLREDVFNNLPNLRTLILSENKIENIAPGLFRGLSRLTRLHLDNNHLTHLEERTFTHIPQINTITLHKNRLRSLATAVFTNLTNLVYLFLTSNRIQYIPNMSFRTNPELTNIFLDTNMVERLYDNSFYGAVSLKTITLVENPLEVIEEGAFLSLPNLTMVSLINSFVATPLVIWPTLLPTNMSFAVSQSENTSSLDLGITLKNIEAGFLLSALGYSCPEYLGPSPDTCYPCGRGHYLPTGFYACKACPPGGFYQDEIGYIGEEIFGIKCKQCPRGTFVQPEMAPGKSRTDCRSCPQGTSLSTFAKFRACRCMKEYYRLDRYGRCFICTKGYVCKNESIDLAAGFYWIWETKQQQDYKQFKKDLLISDGSHKYPVFKGVISKAYACPIAEACLGGEQSRCKQGYKGPLCAVCEKGYIQMITNCQLCPTLPWMITQMVLVAVLVIILVAITLREKKKDAGSSSRTLTDILLARLKIVIGFYHVSSATFDSFSYISWPDPVVTIMKYAKMVQFNLLQIAPLSCINDAIKTNAYARFLSSIVITGVVIIFGVLFHFILKVYTRNKKEKSSVATEEHETKISQHKQKCYRFLLLILFITFPSTFTHVVQVLPVTCHKICSSGDHNCKSYLKADYSIQCDTAKHNVYGTISFTALVYCIGFPLVLFLILRNGKKMKERHGASSVRNNAIQTSIRFLYENYSADCWFWEVVELVRKIVFTCILVLMSAESRLSLGLTSIFSGLYSVIFALYKPIDNLFEHWLQLASLMASSVNFSAGMLMKIPEDETSSGVNQIDGIALTILLVIANVAVIAIVAVKYIASIVTTLISLKEEPRCDVSCCLEVLQVVIDAQGEMTNAWNEPTVTANPVLEQTVEDVTAYAAEEQKQGEDNEGEEEEKQEKKGEKKKVMNEPTTELHEETAQEAENENRKCTK